MQNSFIYVKTITMPAQKRRQQQRWKKKTQFTFSSLHFVSNCYAKEGKMNVSVRKAIHKQVFLAYRGQVSQKNIETLARKTYTQKTSEDSFAFNQSSNQHPKLFTVDDYIAKKKLF